MKFGGRKVDLIECRMHDFPKLAEWSMYRENKSSFFENELLAAFTDEDISILLVSKVNTKDALLKLDEAYSDYQLSIPGAKSINRTTFSLNGINIIQYEIIQKNVIELIKPLTICLASNYCLLYTSPSPRDRG